MNRNTLSFIALAITILYGAGFAVAGDVVAGYAVIGGAIVAISWIAVGRLGRPDDSPRAVRRAEERRARRR